MLISQLKDLVLAQTSKQGIKKKKNFSKAHFKGSTCCLSRY